jgi:DnaK suppressor protein
MMDDAQREQFRHKLLQLRQELLELEANSRDSTRPVELDQTTVGRLSRMDAIQGQQMAQATARRRRLQIQKIDGALGRIDSGEYGHCFICGEEIDPRRLAIDPTHSRCINCVDK